MKTTPTPNSFLHRLFTQKIVSALTVLFLFVATFSTNAITKQYAVADMATLKTDLAAGSADIYELTESGGQYTYSSSSATNITIGVKSAIIRAKSGLAAKPVLKFNCSSASGYVTLFTTSITGLTITFDGIEFDGRSTGTIQPILIYTQTGASNCQLIVKNCYLHHFTTTSGAFFIRGIGASMDMLASVVDNCSGPQILFYTPTTMAGVANYGALTLKNNTFSNYSGTTSLVTYGSSGGYNATGTTATIDHCTFYKSTATDLFAFRQMTGAISISNCIFDQIAGAFSFALPTPTKDYCYLAGFTTVPTGTNSFPASPIPTYNATSLDFSLSNQSLFVCGDGQPAGNTSYYTKLSTPTVGAPSLINSDGFTANWTAVANASSYSVKTYMGSTLLSTTSVNGTSTVLSALLSGVTYTYTVTAVGADGTIYSNSDASAVSAPVKMTGSIFQFQQGFLSTTGWVRTIGSTSANNGLYPGTTGVKFDITSSAPAAGRGSKSVITPSVIGADSVSFYLSKGSVSITTGSFVYVAKIVGLDTIQIGSVEGSSISATNTWQRFAFPVQESGSLKLIFYALNSTANYFYMDDIALTKEKLSTNSVATGASLISDVSFTANWSAVSNATGYNVSVYQEGVLVGTPHYTAGQATTSLSITGLSLGTAYTYKVAATDNSSSFNDADLSAAANVTTTSVVTTLDRTSAPVIVNVFGKTIVTSEMGDLKVYSLQGGLVLQVKNCNEVQTGLASGSYIIHFTNSAGVRSIRKVIIF